MNLNDTITRPTLLLDEQAVRGNIARMNARAAQARVLLRPHFKTHQSREIGGWFRDSGVRAITVSSADMAAWFAADGWDDILLAFPANLRQHALLNRLAGQVRLGLLAEDPATIGRLAEAVPTPFDLWIKVDGGSGRTGLPWDQGEDVLACLRVAVSHAHVRLRGLLTHAGETYQAPNLAAAGEIAARSLERMNGLVAWLNQRGFPHLDLSIGDTPGCLALDEFPGATEIRPGNYVFFDAKQASCGVCSWDEVAVALACPVVAAHPERDEMTVYGGAVHLSLDAFPWQGTRVHGLVALPGGGNTRWSSPLEGAWVARLSQEHGILHIPRHLQAQIPLGSLVCILPAHSCLTAQCMGSYRTLSGRKVEMMPLYST